MVVEVVKGDLFASRADGLVCPVNCVGGVMGKGLAKVFAERYPALRGVHATACNEGVLTPTEPWLWQAKDGKAIVLLATKQHWRERSFLGRIVASIAALPDLLWAYEVERLAVPALGCGEGGIDWNEARPILVQALETLAIPVELYAPHKEE